MPDGWEIRDGYVTKGDEADRTLVGVGAGIVEHVYADRCKWASTQLDPPLGPTVADLAIAFSTIWGSDATAPVDVTIDGYAGKSMVMTVPDDVDFAECDSQHFVGWSDPDHAGPSRWYQGPGQILRHWILDVNGERLLIEVSHFPELPAEGLAELETIIDSIQRNLDRSVNQVPPRRFASVSGPRAGGQATRKRIPLPKRERLTSAGLPGPDHLNEKAAQISPKEHRAAFGIRIRALQRSFAPMGRVLLVGDLGLRSHRLASSAGMNRVG